MIKAIDRFYSKHPKTAFAVAILIAFACMCLSHAWDEDDNAKVQIRMMSSHSGAA